MASGCYIYDFKRFLLRNQSPHANLKFFGPNRAFPTIMEYFDRSLPGQRPIEESLINGLHEYDLWINSKVCQGAHIGGMIPFKSRTKYKDQHTLDTSNSYIGAVDVVMQLLESRTLRKSEEVAQFLQRAREGTLSSTLKELE